MGFQCHVCGKEYTNKFNFNYHVAHHFDARPFACEFPGCLNAYKTKADLSQHQKSHEKALGLSFECRMCSMSFESSTKLNVHKRETHFSKGTSTWCELCCRDFTNLTSHRDIVHLKIRNFVCDLDGKRFGKMNGLVRHIQAVHLGITPFSCPQCSKKFKERSALKKHMNRHTRVRTYVRFRKPQPDIKDWSEDEEIITHKMRFTCGSCNHGYSSTAALLKHEARFHPNAKYSCDLCAHRFTTKKNISQHIFHIHFLKKQEKKIVAAKMFKCGACKTILSTKNGLERHKRIVHMAIYDFLCEQCSATFRDRSTLNKHLVNFHNQEASQQTSFECPSCGKGFQTLFALEKHEIVCRLKKQEMFNRELDKEANFLPMPLLKVEDEITIKEEPVEYAEQLLDLINLPIKEEPVESDPFDISQVIKLEDEIITLSDVEDAAPPASNSIKQEAPSDVEIDELFNFDEPLEASSLLEVTIKEEPMDIEPVKVMKLVTKIKCKLCPERFHSKDEFTKHFKSIHVATSLDPDEPPQRSIATRASKVVSPAVNLRPPRRKQTPVVGKKFKCKICCQLFNLVEDLDRHNLKMHAIAQEQEEVIKFHCVYCPEVFGDSWQLRQHYQGDHLGQEEENDEEALIGEIIREGEEDVTDGEPEDVDEERLMGMFRGGTFNVFAKAFECQLCEKSCLTLQKLKLHCVKDHRIKKFKCNCCNHSFGDLHRFRRHWGRKHAKLPYQQTLHRRHYPIPNENVKCPQCSKILSQKESLKRHIELVHNTERPILYCDQCAETFIDYRTLKCHIQRVHETFNLSKTIVRRRKTTKPVACEECGEVVYGKMGLFTHRWNKHLNFKIIGKNRFHCLICKQVSNCRVSAMRHHVQVHDNGKLLIRTCRECNTEFELYDDFKKHVDEEHESRHICLVCGVSLNSSIDLFLHTKVHRAVPENEKRWTCDMCGFKAQQKVTIEAHMVKQHGAKKREYFATCEFCGASFNCYQSFQTHKMSHRAAKGYKFKCGFCEKSYYNVRDLRNHEGSHTNPEDRPYRCEVEGCNREYFSFSSYRWHLKYSHKQNRNQCKTCLEVFTSREKLIAHTDELHPELRRFSCCYCGKSFASQSANVKHMKNCEPTTVD